MGAGASIVSDFFSKAFIRRTGMAKISETTRGQLAEAIQPYQKQIDDLLAKEKTLIDLMKSDHAGEAYKKLQLAEDMVFVSSLYMA